MGKYKQQAKEARLRVLDMVYKAQSSHIGSNFSVIDILTVLFANLQENDKVILSAGWKAAAFYYFLSKYGHFPEEWLDTYNQEGSRLIGLTEPGVPGVLFAGGSMQMGLPAAVGFALAKKINNEPGRVFCIMSDGEVAGGMTWEAALIARAHGLNNLTVIVDHNGLQAMGDSDNILYARFPDVGFKVREINGHNHLSIENAIKKSAADQYPSVLFCRTVKGKGVSFMEDNNLYHYKNLTEEEYQKAKSEIYAG